MAQARVYGRSHAKYPKQFIHFFDGKDQSLLGATLQRACLCVNCAPPIIMCNNDHRFLVRDELKHADLEAQAVILEPIGRNTAPVIAVAALVAQRCDDTPILAVMPSDHVVGDVKRFNESIKCAADIAATG